MYNICYILFFDKFIFLLKLVAFNFKTLPDISLHLSHMCNVFNLFIIIFFML